MPKTKSKGSKVEPTPPPPPATNKSNQVNKSPVKKQAKKQGTKSKRSNTKVTPTRPAQTPNFALQKTTELFQKLSHKDDSTPITRALQSFGQGPGSTITGKDGHFVVTDYFDYAHASGQQTPKPFVSFDWNTKQNLLATGAYPGFGSLLAFVDRCRVYAYPRSVNEGNATSLYAVIAGLPGTIGDSDQTILDQTTTVVCPTFTPEWHKVFDYKAKDLFDRNWRPQFLGSIQTLFRLAIFNQDDLTTLDDTPIQLKVVLNITQAFSPAVKASFAVSYVEEINSAYAGVSPSENPCYIDFRGVSKQTNSQV